MRLPRTFFAPALVFALLAARPVPAAAQWSFQWAAGASHSLDADVSIRQPSQGIALDFLKVRFDGQSNYPRRYYSVRIGHMGGSGRLGWEIEQIHLKAVGLTNRTYDVTAVGGTSLPATGVSPMNAYVQEYQMTHGVNLAVFNLVVRRPLGGDSAPVALDLRLGAGASFPHAESTVNGGVVHQYEYGGPGAQAAAGVHVRLLPRIAAISEYKFTWTRPKIDIAEGGAGWTTLLSHHFTVGFSVGLTR